MCVHVEWIQQALQTGCDEEAYLRFIKFHVRRKIIAWNRTLLQEVSQLSLLQGVTNTTLTIKKEFSAPRGSWCNGTVPGFVFWSHLIPTAARYRRFPMTKVWEVPKTGLHQHLKGKCNFDTVWYRLISTFRRNMLSQFSGLGPGWRGSDFGENVLVLYRLQRFEKCGQTLQTCSGTAPDRPIESVSYSDGTYFEYQSDSRLTCWDFMFLHYFLENAKLMPSNTLCSLLLNSWPTHHHHSPYIYINRYIISQSVQSSSQRFASDACMSTASSVRNNATLVHTTRYCNALNS